MLSTVRGEPPITARVVFVALAVLTAGPIRVSRISRDVRPGEVVLLTIEAAKSGDPRVAARALLANPLVRQWKHVAALLDDILRENAQLLPRFAAARSTTGA